MGMLDFMRCSWYMMRHDWLAVATFCHSAQLQNRIFGDEIRDAAECLLAKRPLFGLRAISSFQLKIFCFLYKAIKILYF